MLYAGAMLTPNPHWTPALAEGIAGDDGIGPLTEPHWRVLGFCREEAARRGIPPSLEQIVRECRIDTASLTLLFGRHPRLEVLRIAGLAGETSNETTSRTTRPTKAEKGS